MKAKGFTLIELIIVVAIVALLASAVFVAINPARRLGESNDSKRWADLVSISKAVELYVADNSSLPSDLATSTVAVGMKVVLCNSSAVLTCGNDTYGCLVLDDSDFLGVYLPTIPVDPQKSSAADSGYYLTRATNGNISFGACDAYSDSSIETAANIALPSYSVVCGDGLTQGTEVCDDGDLVNEGCGNGLLEKAGSNYCNSTCTANITIAAKENCDWIGWSNDCYTNQGWYASTEVGMGTWCSSDCISYTDNCLPPP